MRYSMMKYVLFGLVLQTLVTLFAGAVYASSVPETQAGKSGEDVASFVTIATAPGATPYFLESYVGPANKFSNFGSAVSSWKDGATGIRWAVVGAPNDNAAYVFHLDVDAKQWHQDVKLTPNDGAGADMFGAAVSLYGGTIAVGAPGHQVGTHAGAGRVYVYLFDVTTGSASLQSTIDGEPADHIGTGTSVAVVGDTLMAGAPAASSNGVVWVATRSGAIWTYVQKLAPSAASGFTFGKSLAFDGSRLVVGMPNDSTPANDSSGSAFTFQFNGSSWAEEQKLTPSDPETYGHFGSAVALYQDTIAVGARDHDNASGAVYSFKFVRIDRDWIQKSILTELNGFQFGISVSLSNGLLAVGSAFNSSAAVSMASVYSGSADNWQPLDVSLDDQRDDIGKPVWIDTDIVLAGSPDSNRFTSSVYRNGVWESLQKQSPLATDNERFGEAVAVSGNVAAFDTSVGTIKLFSYDPTGVWQLQSTIARSNGSSYVDAVMCPNLFASGDTLLVGDPTQTVGGAGGQGAVYIYDSIHSAPVRTAFLVNPTGSSGDNFGCSVSISGNRLAIGAPSERSNAGAVYIFVNAGGTWSIEQVLRPPTSMSSPHFGTAVAISGDTVFVGAPFYDPGSVFIYGRGTGGWSLQKQLVAPGGTWGDDFGAPLSLSGNSLAVGAPRRSFGSVLVYTGAAATWNFQQEIAGGSGDALFGQSLALAGDELAVGASDPAHVSMYTRSNGTWRTHATISADNNEGAFSLGVALSNGTLVVGAPKEAGGRGYIFRDDDIFKNGFE
jgi:hypothetical protein